MAEPKSAAPTSALQPIGVSFAQSAPEPDRSRQGSGSTVRSVRRSAAVTLLETERGVLVTSPTRCYLVPWANISYVEYDLPS